MKFFGGLTLDSKRNELLSEVEKFELRKLAESLTAKGDEPFHCVICGEELFAVLTAFPFRDNKGAFFLCNSCYLKSSLSKVKCCANCLHYLLISRSWLCSLLEKEIEKPYEQVCECWEEMSFEYLR